MEVVPNIEVNVDTVYVRSNIVAVNESDFTGWEYDEVQYEKNEYIELTTKNVAENQGAIDFIVMNF